MSPRIPHFALALLLLAAGSGTALATVGFAEWEVYTPGGHLISHTDGWKEEHGDCLRSEGSTSEVFVSHLEQWRFFDGYVIGEAKDGYFIFDERDRRVRTFENERTLQNALRKLDLGPARSPWLTARDGWNEAWFPFVTWGPCTEGNGGGRSTALSGESCAEALRPERLERYRTTTWGRICKQKAGAAMKDPVLRRFCSVLLDP